MSEFEYYDLRKHSPVKNYVIPGLTNYLVGTNHKQRLFYCSRNHQEVITPHNHRYSLQCKVLKGSVVNRSWFESGDEGDEYAIFESEYNNEIGNYSTQEKGKSYFKFRDLLHQEGDSYFIHENSIHSIWFSKDTAVLVEEGKTIRNTNVYIEPVVDGVIIPTIEIKSWMFTK